MTCHIWLFFVMFQRVIFCSKSTAFQIQRHWVPKNKYFKIMGNSLSDNHHPYPVLCDDELMNKKAHGTCPKPVMDNLRWGCDYKTADNICCYNRHYAEHSGYFEYTSSFLKEVDKNSETTYYDSVTGKALFIAPRGRSFSAFLTESQAHGWPSFRDDEVHNSTKRFSLQSQTNIIIAHIGRLGKCEMLKKWRMRQHRWDSFRPQLT